MLVRIRELRINDRFTIGGATYRKVRKRYDTTTGLVNAINIATSAVAYFPPSVAVTPNNEYWQVRQTPIVCEPTLRQD